MRILNYADKASSVASILSTATAEDYPELSKVLNVTSLALGVADFSTNGVQSLKNLNANPSDAVNLINRSENVLDAGNHIQNVENLALRILDETPDELMNQVLHSSNPHSRALLEDVLEKERHIADGAGHTDIVAKLDDALDVVRNASRLTDFLDELPANIRKIHDNLLEAGTPFVFADNRIVYKTFSGNSFGKIEGDDFIITVTKDNIPFPSEYLSEAYMIQHLNKFGSNGGAFIVRKSDITQKPEYPSMPPRKFVGLRSEMDKVIQSFENSNNNVQVLIDELDLTPNYFNIPEDEIYYVIVPPNGQFIFDIPTGREFGAYENFWVPSGYTKHGTAEAVLSNSGSFAHNNNWETYVGFFGSNNVIRIK